MTIKVIAEKSDFPKAKIECHHCKSLLEFSRGDTMRSKKSPKRREIICPACDTRIDVGSVRYEKIDKTPLKAK